MKADTNIKTTPPPHLAYSASGVETTRVGEENTKGGENTLSYHSLKWFIQDKLYILILSNKQSYTS